jgi:CRISPR/Cas system endoribonuclease Cas6 (RAMP superfamily)
VKSKINLGLDFEVDKLTNSIENVVTGDSFATEISLLSKHELKIVSKKNGWLFNWTEEYKQPERDIYKLTITGNPTIIQGLISLEVKSDMFICI